jgi:hypothetical protein
MTTRQFNPRSDLIDVSIEAEFSGPALAATPSGETQWLKRVRSQQFWLFPHWALEARLNIGSRMNGDIHVRI